MRGSGPDKWLRRCRLRDRLMTLCSQRRHGTVCGWGVVYSVAFFFFGMSFILYLPRSILLFWTWCRLWLTVHLLVCRLSSSSRSHETRDCNTHTHTQSSAAFKDVNSLLMCLFPRSDPTPLGTLVVAMPASLPPLLLLLRYHILTNITVQYDIKSLTIIL